MANWIASAIKKPGALHAEMGVPQGQKISAEAMDKFVATRKAEGKYDKKTAARVALAKRLKAMH
jgi:hypothetical protein